MNEIAQPIEWAYFINSGLASFLNVMADGKCVEVGLAGKEGFVGLPLLAGFSTSPSRAEMQVDGSAFRISAVEMRNALKTSLSLDRSLQRFSQVLGMQAPQVAACNRLHEVHERLARWLLMSQDRLVGDAVPLTQETLANMLGTRRASVTEAAGVLQKAGLITYRRGDVKIDDRRGLEAASCECYVAMQRLAEKWQKRGKFAALAAVIFGCKSSADSNSNFFAGFRDQLRDSLMFTGRYCPSPGTCEIVR